MRIFAAILTCVRAFAVRLLSTLQFGFPPQPFRSQYATFLLLSVVCLSSFATNGEIIVRNFLTKKLQTFIAVGGHLNTYEASAEGNTRSLKHLNDATLASNGAFVGNSQRNDAISQ